MEQSVIEMAHQLLAEPVELETIPIQRAANALGTALTKGSHRPEYHLVRFLEKETKSNLYITFSSLAAKDENGNYDSPIFQDSRYNHLPPLWHLFRLKLEEKMGTKLVRVLYGEYRQESDNEGFFEVKDEPIQGHWICIEKPGDKKYDISQLAPYEAKEHQSILDNLKKDRAYKIARERSDREHSSKHKEAGIAYLKAHYAEYFDRFIFEKDVFRFRQFTTEFTYTLPGLETFNKFYQDVAEPYRQDELAQEEWKKMSEGIRIQILNDPEFATGLIRERAHEFKFTPKDNGCEITIDIIDDSTGREFTTYAPSQEEDAIIEAIKTKLRVVLQRKEQNRRAIGTLQRLAARGA